MTLALRKQMTRDEELGLGGVAKAFENWYIKVNN